MSRTVTLSPASSSYIPHMAYIRAGLEEGIPYIETAS